MTNKIDWQQAKCPYCREQYFYTPDYKPTTCGKFDCVFAHMHPKAVEARRKRMEGGVPMKK